MLPIRVIPIRRPLETGESFFGYLLRRAQLNAYSSLHDITSIVGNTTSDRGLGVIQGYFHELCELLELDHKKAICHVFWHTGEKTRDRAWLFGNLPLGAGSVDLKRPKLCPECLDESEVIRAEWELTFLTVCPRHHRPLIDSCSHCGCRIGWGRRFIRRCKNCGGDFSRSAYTASADEAFLAKLIVEKLHAPARKCRSNERSSFLSSISLSALIEISIFVGGLLAGLGRIGASRMALLSLEKRREVMRHASSVINERWPLGVGPLVDQFLAKEPFECRTGYELLPGLYKPLIWRYQREGFQELASEIGRYISKSHPDLFSMLHGQSALFLGAQGRASLEPVSDFCKRVGICSRNFRRLAKDLKLPQGENQGNTINVRRLTREQADLVEAEVQKRRSDRSSLPLMRNGTRMSLAVFRRGEMFPCAEFNEQLAAPLSISAIAQRLDISAEATKRVLHAIGALELMPDVAEAKNPDRVSFAAYAEFERSLAKVMALALGCSITRSGIGIGDAVRNKLRRYDIDTAALITWILDGRVKIAGADFQASGLNRILLSEEDISDAMSVLRAPRSTTQLNAEGVKKLLQLPRIGVVYELRRAGYIHGVQTGAKRGGSIVFDVSSIENFRCRYITLSELISHSKAASGQKSHGGIRRLLAAAGIEPEFKLSAGGSSVPFYNRDSCSRITFRE